MSDYNNDAWEPLDPPATTGRNRLSNFIPAIAPGQPSARAYPIEAHQDNTILDLGRALDAQDLNETTTPFDRSVAFTIRIAPLIGLLAGLAYGLMLIVMTGDVIGWAILIFTVLGCGAYYYLNQLDYDHSPAGVEKDKIQAIERVTLDKQRGERALRREVMRGYLRTLTGGEDNV